jgi:ABC-type cobalamin/Fe3+-siderophores transport system ATPase subunit
VTALIGRNGSGKSMLLRIMRRLTCYRAALLQ